MKERSATTVHFLSMLEFMADDAGGVLLYQVQQVFVFSSLAPVCGTVAASTMYVARTSLNIYGQLGAVVCGEFR